MSEQQPSASQNERIITRAAVVAQIEARLAGTLTDKALAGWAFNRFYAEELGNEIYEPGAEQPIAAVLDGLMFGDDPGFQLDEKELRGLLAQLGTL